MFRKLRIVQQISVYHPRVLIYFDISITLCGSYMKFRYRIKTTLFPKLHILTVSAADFNQLTCFGSVQH